MIAIAADAATGEAHQPYQRSVQHRRDMGVPTTRTIASWQSDYGSLYDSDKCHLRPQIAERVFCAMELDAAEELTKHVPPGDTCHLIIVCVGWNAE